MDTFLQKKALSTFHYALRENGILMLGKSETTGSSSDLFTSLGKHEKFYLRKPVPGRFMHVLPSVKKKRWQPKTVKPLYPKLCKPIFARVPKTYCC